MKTHLEIAIAGCGIGGLAAAELLGQRGHRITVFDRFEAAAPVGSGLVIQPVGQAVLAKIGVLNGALELGTRITRLSGVENGRTVLDAGYGKAFGLGMHRASLFQVLFEAAKKAGMTLITDAEATRTTLRENARFLTMANGETTGPFDLLIDATGAASPLSPISNAVLPFGALWATVDWPTATTLPVDQLTQKYQAAAIMAGVLPIGRLPGSEQRKAAIFWSLRHHDFAQWQATPLADWAEGVVAFWPEFAPFLALVHTRNDFTMARYSHGTLRRPYSEKLAHIGDAAHTASPQLGQGANMALLDAYALASCLADLPIADALAAYGRARRRHVALYQGLSRFLTPLYQSDHPVPPLIRNRLLAPLSRIAPMPAVLTRMVCGNVIAPVRGYPLKVPQRHAEG